jgi:hypothetical protein
MTTPSAVSPYIKFFPMLILVLLFSFQFSGSRLVSVVK